MQSRTHSTTGTSTTDRRHAAPLRLLWPLSRSSPNRYSVRSSVRLDRVGARVDADLAGHRYHSLRGERLLVFVHSGREGVSDAGKVERGGAGTMMWVHRVGVCMSTGQVEELIGESELQEAYTVMDQLRPVGEAAFVELVEDMRASEDYRLFALRDGPDGELLALAGVAVGVTLYHGRHLYIHDLVVDEPHRGEGYGSRMLSWAADWAEERDCTRIELASGLWRDEAHEFYEQNGMERYCYTFKLELAAEAPY